MHMLPWTHSHTCMHTHVCAHVSIHTYTHAIWGPLSLSPVYSHTVAGSPVLGLLFHKRLRQPAPFTLQAENVAEWFISGKGCQEHLRGKETETKGLGGGRSKGGGVPKLTQNWVRIISQTHDAQSEGSRSPYVDVCWQIQEPYGEENAYVGMKTASSRTLQ